MKYLKAASAIDGYKASHKDQYPKGTDYVYSNLTPRHSKHFAYKDFDGLVVVFGNQSMVKFIHELWQDTFFSKPADEVVPALLRRLSNYSGHSDVEHFYALHKLGQLPVVIKSLAEGTKSPLGVPTLTIANTHPDFAWIVNYLETIISAESWHTMTSATVSHQYKKLLTQWSDLTCDDDLHLPFQAHDFSMRGQTSVHSAAKSGAGHLLSFAGTDTVPSVDFLEYYYEADCEQELVGCSIPATEHSTMTTGIQVNVDKGLSLRDAETAVFKRLLTKIYPTGLFAAVSDSYDFWDTLTITLPELKDTIMARDGKLVIRPDSGNPIDVICGDKSSWLAKHSPEFKGAIQVLWEIFGGTINSKGYKVLDPHIGLIYGDSITLDRADAICMTLESQGFASSNIVFGIGSYSFQGTTRDTFGMAVKATACRVKKKLVDVYKDPVGDSSKKSAKGFLRVDKVNGKYKLSDQVSADAEHGGELRTIYNEGRFYNQLTLAEVRTNLEESE